MRAAFLALAGAIVLGGCASDKLTLSENEEGEATGAVAILDPVTNAERAVLNTKLTEAKLTSRPKPRAVKELKPAYSALLDDMPIKAKTFEIFFPSEGFSIPPEQFGVIRLIREDLARRPLGAQIEVAGFTDTTASEQHNDDVSKKRALAVIAELNALGISVDPEDAVGRGERGASESGDPDNRENPKFRKVEVVIR